MIAIGAGTTFHLALMPVDFHCDIGTSSSYARGDPGIDPVSGIVLVIRARRAGRLEVLYREGTGMVLLNKRPDAGVFRWPPVGASAQCPRAVPRAEMVLCR